MKAGWIYGILFTPLNKIIYVGMTQDSIRRRDIHHRHYLRKGRHFSSKLQILFNKYGDEKFSFIVLEEYKEITREKLGEKESTNIARYKTFNPDMEFSCNNSQGGLGNPAPISKESIDKMIKTKKLMYENETHTLTNGEINGMHVLLEKEVLEIVSLLNTKKHTHQEIANMYGVVRSTIGTICTGKRWNHLKEVRDYVENNPTKSPTKLSNEDIYFIKSLKEIENKTYKEIEKITGFEYDLIRKLPKRQKYKNIELTEEIG